LAQGRTSAQVSSELFDHRASTAMLSALPSAHVAYGYPAGFLLRSKVAPAAGHASTLAWQASWRSAVFGVSVACGTCRRLTSHIQRQQGVGNEHDPLANVPETMWPLLRRAEEADPRYGWMEITQGLDGWRQALRRGRVWEDRDGAFWPDRPLRRLWTETLLDLGLPLFTRRYPMLIEPLLMRLLEIVAQTAEAMAANADWKISRAQGLSPQEQDNSSATQNGAADKPEDAEDNESGDGEGQNQNPMDDLGEAQQKAEELMKEFREDWGKAADAIRDVENTLGIGGAESFSKGFSSEGAPWRESKGWEKARELRALLRKMPELKRLVKRLGRRAALRGQRKWLPLEEEQLGGPTGVVMSVQAPAETSGLRRSGEWQLMMPEEAQLLMKGKSNAALRALHHSRRIEQSLASYNRASWVEAPSRELKTQVMRPAAENGPIILCLDTSGSMQGAPETCAKALTFECVHLAHTQGRRCCLYAFSTGTCLQELELDLSPDGLSKVFEFLQSAFHGGTSLDEVLLASIRRLGSETEHWRNADILLVTDGEVPHLQSECADALQKAQDDFGVRVYGVVVNSHTGDVMDDVCDELYVLKSKHDRHSDFSASNTKDWVFERQDAPDAGTESWKRW